MTGSILSGPYQATALGPNRSCPMLTQLHAEEAGDGILLSKFQSFDDAMTFADTFLGKGTLRDRPPFLPMNPFWCSCRL